MDPTAEESLRIGREAVARYAWREAFEHLAAPDLSGRLCPEDLEGLAAAAWWTGRLGECIAARERAFAGYLESARAGRAARVALELVRDHYAKQNSVVANAWLKRAERLLDELPESVEHGYLNRMRCVIAFEGLRDFDAALAYARQTFDVGTRFGDRDLMAIGLHDEGRVLVAKGQHDRTLRSLFAENAGEEIDHAGDGFFVAFETAASAIECAAAIQRTLAEHRRAHGFSPQVRIGLHTTRATRRGAAYRGKGVHQAARIAAVAEAGEIAASQETIGAIGSLRFRASESRLVRLKGISEPMPVVKLDWRGGSEA